MGWSFRPRHSLSVNDQTPSCAFAGADLSTRGGRRRSPVPHPRGGGAPLLPDQPRRRIFFAFLEDGGRECVQDIGPLDVRDYLEAAKTNGLSTATLKQHMAAVRMLFDHLVTGGVLEHNPALSLKALRQKLGKGKTPVLTPRRPASCCAPSRRTAWWGFGIVPGLE